MLALEVQFLHGTIRASDSNEVAQTGNDEQGEWPPSPARLFSAFVAADGTRQRCTVTTGEELAILESLGPPKIIADRESDVIASTLRSRFVVKDSTQNGRVVQNYPARNSTEVRPGTRLSPRNTTVTYEWEADVESEVVRALRLRAARIPYLGCADSPVRVTVRTNPTDKGSSEPIWMPGHQSGRALPVPYIGFVEELDHAFDTWSAGSASRRAWIPSEFARYRVDSSDHEPLRPTIFWLQFDKPIAARRVAAVAEALRSAVLDRYQRKVIGSTTSDDMPWQLHGHNIPTEVAKPYQLTRFLPLIDAGYSYSDGKARGAAVWLPPDTPAHVAEGVQTALWGMSRFVSPGIFDVGISLHTGEKQPAAINPNRWIGPATNFVSVTPVVADRGSRRAPGLDAVRSWFANAGHPEPTAVRVSPVPIASGSPKLSSHEVHRAGRARYPFYWIQVDFDTPVAGPLCVGRSRSFGLGLLAPVRASR